MSPLVRSVRGLAVLAVIAATELVSQKGSSQIRLYIYGGVFVLLAATATVAWAVTRWRIEDGVLRIESGLLRRTSRRFPPEQLQAVDTVRSAVARVFGVAEVRVRMAASSGTSGRLAYLADADAEALRARLLALAHRVTEDTPAPPEQVLYTVPTGQLIASILLSGLGLVCEVVVVGLVVLAVAYPSALAAALSGGATALVGVVTNVFRRLNSEYELTLAEAPDGLRLRAGLLQTAAETIPRGRVQAVRMIEPLMWRPLGWCRVVVEVAGKQKSGRENRSVSGGARAVLPVGSREQAAWLLERILPGAQVLTAPPPTRVRLKSPLRYRLLTWGVDGSYAVATSGRVRKVTDWVPLAKVQSIRWVEGPVQRRLGVASVHLDTAGRNIHAEARDRDRGEASQLMAAMPANCRAARAAAKSAPPLVT